MKLRRAQPQDTEALSALALRSKAHWGYSAKFMESCRSELTVSNTFVAENSVYLLESGGRIKGFCAFEPDSADRAELSFLFVEPEDIGKGYGRILMTLACREAKYQGFSRMLIQGDPNALGFYLACGSRLIGLQSSASIAGRYLPLLEIDLQAG